MREKCFLLAVLAVVLLSFFLKYAAVGPLSPLGYTDIEDFYIPGGGLPYAGVSFEYPVVIAIFVYTASVLGGNIGGYFFLSSLALGAAALLCAHFLFLSAKGRKLKSRTIPFFAVSLSLLFFTIYNWDILAVLFTAMALYFANRNKNVLASASLSLGFCTKLFPGLFLLPLLMRRNRAECMKIIGVFVLVFLALNAYFMVTSFNGWTYQFTTHSSRGPNIDSVWGVMSFVFPGFSPQISLISFSMLGICYLLLNFKLRRHDYIQACLASLLVFLLFNKVFSSQYVIWLLPFFVLFAPLRRRDFYFLEISNIVVLISILYWYNSVPQGMAVLLSISMAFVVIRHLALLNTLRRMSRTAVIIAASLIVASLAAFSFYASVSGPVIKSGSVSLTFDDGLETQYQNAYPLMSHYGFNGTAYIIANLSSFEGRDLMTFGQEAEMQSSGWEIGSHGMTHLNMLDNPNEAAYEILGSKLAMERRGLKVKSFAIPYGKYDDSVARVVRAQYSSARTSVRGFNDPITDDLYYLKSMWVENTTTPAEVCSWVDDAKANNLWLVLLFHCIGGTERQYDMSVQDFEKVLGCINSSGIAVKTVSEAQNVYRAG